MRHVEVNGVRLSAVGLGTWQFGSREWGYGNDYARGEAGDIVRRALELGITLFDTAEAYGFGASERILGAALGEMGEGHHPFVATKIAPLVTARPYVRARAEGSRRRLGVDSIDLYQVHWPNPVLPPGPLFAELAALRDRGVLRHVGVSNYSLGRWQQAERLLGATILSNQVRYHLVDRRPEAELLGWAQREGRLVIAYSPLAQGFLSARYHVDHRPGGVRATNPLFAKENLRRAAPLFDTLRQVAGTHDATPSQVALAWVIRHPNVVVIPGASSVAQLEANAAAADLNLSDDEVQALEEASHAFHPISGAPAVTAMVRDRLRV